MVRNRYYRNPDEAIQRIKAVLSDQNCRKTLLNIALIEKCPVACLFWKTDIDAKALNQPRPSNPFRKRY